MKFPHYIFLFLILAIISCASLHVFLRTNNAGNELRGAVTPYLRALDFSDYSANIENNGTSTRTWSIRAEAQRTLFSPQIINAVQFLQDAPILAKTGMADSRQQEIALNNPSLLAPLFALDEAASSKLYAALPFDWHDPLDADGHPVRWRLSRPLLAGYSTPRSSRNKVAQVAKSEIVKPQRLPKLPASARAEHYRELVNNFARRYNLSSDLVMAIIHSESDFTPTVVSNKSAMGLMQLLPSTASGEVHRFLYGKRGQVSFEQLRIPEINIRYGTAYLHILLNRYFPDIKNRSVQEACAIAAYNMGPNRFIRLYGSTNDAAIAKINAMDEETFFADLLKRLPVRETRSYVEKVRRMKKHYSSLP